MTTEIFLITDHPWLPQGISATSPCSCSLFPVLGCVSAAVGAYCTPPAKQLCARPVGGWPVRRLLYILRRGVVVGCLSSFCPKVPQGGMSKFRSYFHAAPLQDVYACIRVRTHSVSSLSLCLSLSLSLSSSSLDQCIVSHIWSGIVPKLCPV